MKNSSFLSLHTKDLIKGAIMAALTSMGTALGTYIEHGSFPSTLDMKHQVLIGIAAGIAYLCKNFFTNSDGQILKRDQE